MHRETLPNTLLTDNVLNNGEEYLSRDKWYGMVWYGMVLLWYINGIWYMVYGI